MPSDHRPLDDLTKKEIKKQNQDRINQDKTRHTFSRPDRDRQRDLLNKKKKRAVNLSPESILRVRETLQKKAFFELV